MKMKPTYAERPDFDPPRAINRETQMWTQCPHCTLWFSIRIRAYQKEGRRFCSQECARLNAIETGKFAGAKNPRWLGGVSNDNMRYRRRQIERHPVEEAARRAVHEAVRSGKLVRQPCEKCGKEPSQGHHEDYAKPLEVRWLCRGCHDEEHRLERRRERVVRFQRNQSAARSKP